MNFEYQAIDGDGSIVRGIVKAKDRLTVLKILLHKQLHPLDIKELSNSTIELSRLNQLKQKLKPQPKTQKPKQEPTIQPKPTPIRKSNNLRIDWTYVLFVIGVILIIIAYLNQDIPH